MTPKTQREKYISSLATLLRPITNNQLEYAKKHCFYHYAVKNGKHLHCTECCHDWYSDATNKTIVCPHCGKRLKIKHSQKRTFHFSSYLCVTSKLKEFQVFRYFLVDKSVNYYVNEVAQFWCDASGKTTIFARNRKMFAYYSNSPWVLFKPMTLKRIGRYDARYDICPSATIVKSVLPILKRNGFSSQLCGMNPKEYCNTILTSPQHETLLKAKQYSAFRYFTTDNIERYWSSLKIALRNKYIIKDAQLWRDMIDSLQYCGADIHNAKFVCPLDLKKTHDMWSAKVSKIRQKRFEEERMKRAKENEQKFIQSKGKKVMFWGDIINKAPELLKELPENVTPINWGYSPLNPAESACQEYEKLGLKFVPVFETFEYKGNVFTVWEELDYFILVVNDETYLLDSMADVREFIQYYTPNDDFAGYID